MPAAHGPHPTASRGDNRNPAKQRRSQSRNSNFTVDLSTCLIHFVARLLPTPEDMAAKEDIRKLLERLIRIAEPESRLLAFGSTVNGLGLRYSDMDLCCLLDGKSSQMAPSALVQTLGELLKQETKFDVKLLPNARVPIIKLCLSPSAGLPFGIACDIGFENRLALENTRLLLSYTSIDPTRVRAIVLFLKFWSKCRNINSPYNGTLSSYGYSLLVLYFLIHVKNPPVLPNLQGMSPHQSLSVANDTHIKDHEAWFFDDIDRLRESWTSPNEQSIAELLIDLFRFYAREFPYADGVISIRQGLLKKADNGWPNDSGALSPRECNRFCIEDPFQTTYNVARTVTREGLFLIRGEFMRASKILSARSNPAPMVLCELCVPTTPSSQSPALATLEPRAFDLYQEHLRNPKVFSNTSFNLDSPPLTHLVISNLNYAFNRQQTGRGLLEIVHWGFEA